MAQNAIKAMHQSQTMEVRYLRPLPVSVTLYVNDAHAAPQVFACSPLVLLFLQNQKCLFIFWWLRIWNQSVPTGLGFDSVASRASMRGFSGHVSAQREELKLRSRRLQPELFILYQKRAD